MLGDGIEHRLHGHRLKARRHQLGVQPGQVEQPVQQRFHGAGGAMQLGHQRLRSGGVACPVNWKKGDKVIVPPPKSEKEVAARKALQGVERLDFYLIKKSL